MVGAKALARVACLAVVVSSVGSIAFAQEFRAVGGEFQVNTYTQTFVGYPDVGMASTGDFVVVWQSYNQDGAYSGAFGQRVDAAGVRLGAEFQVSTYTVGFQGIPRVAVNSGGGFVVVWSHENDVFARRFNVGGVALGPPFEVDQQPGTRYNLLAVAGNDAFVVAWEATNSDGGGTGLLARRFDSSGTAQGGEFQVNTYTPGNQSYPAVATQADGDFVVVWRSAQDGNQFGIFGRRFDASGGGLAVEFQVNSYTVGDQREILSVAMASDGRFVVAWQSFFQDGYGGGVFAQRFDSAGIAQSAEFQVNTITAFGQEGAELAMDGDGNFIVVWQSNGQDGDQRGIFARRFDASGVALGVEFQVNSHTIGSSESPTVATNARGDVVVAWTAFDGFGTGMFAQRYRQLAVFDVDGNGSSDPLTDGLLVLRYLFGFRGAVLATGAVDLDDCTRCDAAAIEAYLEPRV